MDGYPETVVLAYKVNMPKKKKEPVQKQPKPKKPPPQPKREKKKRGNDKTLKAIGKSTGEDVCSCIRVLTEYIKEAVKLVLCTPAPGQCDTKFGYMFCELGDITIRLFQDAFNLAKFLLKTIVCFLSKQ